jgi:hypothetical protein
MSLRKRQEVQALLHEEVRQYNTGSDVLAQKITEDIQTTLEPFLAIFGEAKKGNDKHGFGKDKREARRRKR